jgi:hypothetical protein
MVPRLFLALQNVDYTLQAVFLRSEGGFAHPEAQKLRFAMLI